MPSSGFGLVFALSSVFSPLPCSVVKLRGSVLGSFLHLVLYSVPCRTQWSSFAAQSCAQISELRTRFRAFFYVQCYVVLSGQAWRHKSVLSPGYRLVFGLTSAFFKTFDNSLNIFLFISLTLLWPIIFLSLQIQYSSIFLANWFSWMH